MYTGTLINDLMATVERAEQRVAQRARRQEAAVDAELRMLEAIYTQTYNQARQQESVLAGAA
jgi:deoxyadenosine/deoxycytidine kinase